MNGEANGERPGKPFASWWARDIITSESCQLSAMARALLMLLAAYTNAAYYCEPSIELLARGLGLTVMPGKRTHRSTVQRARAELVAAGLVIVFAGVGRGHSNGYWLAVTGMPPAQPNGRSRTAITETNGRSPAAISYPQRPLTNGHSNGEVIQKGRWAASEKAAAQRPEVDREVSRKRARVSSPPQTHDGEEPKLTPAQAKRIMFDARRAELAAKLGKSYRDG